MGLVSDIASAQGEMSRWIESFLMLHYWYSKGHGVYQPLGMVHIKAPLLLMERAFTHGAMCHRIDSSYPLSYFLFQPVIHDWCNKDHGMCYPLPLIGKSSPCSGSSRFPLSLSGWSFTICPMSYSCK